MEITPTLLLALGEGPARAVLRFKEDAAWRPQPARQAVQALLIGVAPPPAPAGLAAQLSDWQEDCHWLALPPRRSWDAAWLAEGLRPAWDRALSARGLDRLRQLPGYRPRVAPHHERFAPDVCLLAAAAGPETAHLEGIVIATAAETARPIHLVLALPAPHDGEWGQAVTTVARLSALARSRPHLLGRVWLASRERATGELLDPADLEGALAHFCRLIAYAGRSGDPLLARLFRPLAPEPVWGTFGVQALAWPVAEQHPRALIAAARAMVAATGGVAPPEDVPGPGPGALADAEPRDPVLRRALPPLPEPPSPHSLPAGEVPAVMAGWWAWLLLRHVLDRRRLSARLEDLIGAVRSWAAVRGAEAAYRAALHALRDLERWLDDRRQADAALLELLGEADGVLAGLAPAAIGPSDPATTLLVDPLGHLEFSGVSGLTEEEVRRADAETVAAMALRRARSWLDGGALVEALHGPLARTMSAIAAQEPGPVPVLLPLRLALPESGEPLPAVTVSLTGLRPPPDRPRWPDEHQVGDDPFALVRMTLCAPIPLSGTQALAGLREGEDSA